MSEYLALKQEIEELQRAHEKRVAELTVKLDNVRRAEYEAEVADIKRRVIAFGINPKDIFPDMPARPAREPRERNGRTMVKRQPKYRWNGHEWGGPPGPTPKWYSDALAAGISESQMRVQQ